MAVASEASRPTPGATPAPASSRDGAQPLEPRAIARRPDPARPATATDDEILGLDSTGAPSVGTVGAGFKPAPTTDNPDEASGTMNDQSLDAPIASPDSEALRTALDANPDLRRAWDDAQAYRETFASPEEARAATALLADLDRMDALFFSRRPEDHAELARAVASLDPAAFASLAQAMSAHASGSVGAGLEPAPIAETTAPHDETSAPTAPTQAQSDFFRSANAAAVESVLDAIETQVERLLPENISKSARNRVVGEIYRELDTTLRSNSQLAQQMRDALRSGSLDAEHQRAVVSLVTGRARQALPGVAKRVLSEWTSTVVAAHNDRRARQHAAERRIDIAGSSGTGSDGPRSIAPREVDYKRMSDADILNL